MITILGIDTSCDDTAIAIVKASGIKKLEIVSNIVSSQTEIHQEYGGVYPGLAKRNHKKNLPLVLEQALKDQGQANISAIAVTIGPGLDPCLWQGINFAKELARQRDLPIIPVNHIEAHLIANFLSKIGKISQLQTGPKFKQMMPAIGLVASGGHTQLILIKRVGNYKVIGETRDDAAGECLDKTARILGLPYPGGPAIEREASKLKTKNYQLETKLPRPMIDSKNYEFSFSGLKTAVLYDYKERSKKVRQSKPYIRAMAKEIQQAVIDVLLTKTLKAAKHYQTKAILLGGGVVANKELRTQFRREAKKEIANSNIRYPNTELCTDNAAMIAATGFFHQDRATKRLKTIKAHPNLKIG